MFPQDVSQKAEIFQICDDDFNGLSPLPVSEGSQFTPQPVSSSQYICICIFFALPGNWKITKSKNHNNLLLLVHVWFLCKNDKTAKIPVCYVYTHSKLSFSSFTYYKNWVLFEFLFFKVSYIIICIHHNVT